MKNTLLAGLLALVCITGCKKPLFTIHTAKDKTATAKGFQPFLIKAGNHYCEDNAYKLVDLKAQTITVRFDSTAIYTTTNKENQYDINKLWGFSDNNSQHHQFSARLGWRWSDGALRLFAYVYNEGKVEWKELTTVAIGQSVQCSIGVVEGAYQFGVNGAVWRLPRLAQTATARGYQLYPYFGGDEAAPHDVRIWIKEEPPTTN